MSPLDLRGLLAALHDGEVRFVLIGGVAVGAHGYVRATEDVDIVPDPSPENVRRLGNALVAMDATLPLADGVAITVDTGKGALDIVQRAPGVPGFAELDSAAVEADLLGVPVRVCSLAHLRVMKQARGASQDLADLERLPQGD